MAVLLKKWAKKKCRILYLLKTFQKFLFKKQLQPLIWIQDGHKSQFLKSTILIVQFEVWKSNDKLHTLSQDPIEGSMPVMFTDRTKPQPIWKDYTPMNHVYSVWQKIPCSLWHDRKRQTAKKFLWKLKDYSPMDHVYSVWQKISCALWHDRKR